MEALLLNWDFLSEFFSKFLLLIKVSYFLISFAVDGSSCLMPFLILGSTTILFFFLFEFLNPLDEFSSSFSMP